MKLRIVLAGLVCVAAALGQKFSWQDHCFNNPGSPACKGHEYAVKPAPKENAPSGVTRTMFPSIQNGGPRSGVAGNFGPGGAPIMDAVGSAMNWKFADPASDVIAGVSVKALASSDVAKHLVGLLATQGGLSQPDIDALFQKLSDVDQVIVSVKNNQIVAFVIGPVPDAIIQVGSVTFPDTGLKAVQVSKFAMLVGHVAAVDQALARIADGAPLSGLTPIAELRARSGAEFWAIGASAFVTPEAAHAGAMRSALTVWIRDMVTTELAFDMTSAPTPAALRAAQAKLGPVAVEGNTVFTRTAINPNDLVAQFPAMMGGPIGGQLSALVSAARYLPAADPAAKKRKPVIVGLDDPSK
ncbi:MAG TPA: hypothetical protein VGL53_10585 [Bryobacteraceae bacterium]|jgi:hypothetical protein